MYNNTPIIFDDSDDDAKDGKITSQDNKQNPSQNVPEGKNPIIQQDNKQISQNLLEEKNPIILNTPIPIQNYQQDNKQINSPQNLSEEKHPIIPNPPIPNYQQDNKQINPIPGQQDPHNPYQNISLLSNQGVHQSDKKIDHSEKEDKYQDQINESRDKENLENITLERWGENINLVKALRDLYYYMEALNLSVRPISNERNEYKLPQRIHVEKTLPKIQNKIYDVTADIDKEKRNVLRAIGGIVDKIEKLGFSLFKEDFVSRKLNENTELTTEVEDAQMVLIKAKRKLAQSKYNTKPTSSRYNRESRIFGDISKKRKQ